jgi:hypothetical protein
MNNTVQSLNSVFEYDKNTLLERNDLIALSNSDEDLVILDEEENHYFAINSVGHRIWSLLDSRKTVDQLIFSLMEIYQVNYDACFMDIKAFLQTMIDQKLIKVG